MGYIPVGAKAVVHATELVCQNSLGEPVDDADDIWWIPEGQDYPRLWWELDNW